MPAYRPLFAVLLALCLCAIAHVSFQVPAIPGNQQIKHSEFDASSASSDVRRLKKTKAPKDSKAPKSTKEAKATKMPKDDSATKAPKNTKSPKN
jgi:hypothetical protein